MLSGIAWTRIGRGAGTHRLVGGGIRGVLGHTVFGPPCRLFLWWSGSELNFRRFRGDYCFAVGGLSGS